jgi:hypothetical protein
MAAVVPRSGRPTLPTMTTETDVMPAGFSCRRARPSTAVLARRPFRGWRNGTLFGLLVAEVDDCQVSDTGEPTAREEQDARGAALQGEDLSARRKRRTVELLTGSVWQQPQQASPSGGESTRLGRVPLHSFGILAAGLIRPFRGSSVSLINTCR